MLRRRLSCLYLLLILALVNSLAAQTTRRPMKLDDLTRFRNVSDPQISPDGQWVAYVVGTTDAKDDKSTSHIWMVNINGSNNRRITFSQESESSPRWSPDGKYISFTSSRPGKARGNQVWLLDRNGGEAMQLTELKGRLQGHEWSPDSKRLALLMADPDPESDPAPSPQPGATPRVPKPIVIDRYRYKQDGPGYLLSGRHTYIYIFDIATEKQLTSDTTRASRARPEWSPDSKSIAFIEGDEKKYGAYNMDHLALVPSDGSSAPVPFKASEDLDRAISSPRFTPDGKAIQFLVTDDRSVYPMKANVSGGAAQRLLNPPVVMANWNFNGGRAVAISGGDTKAGEIHVWEGNSLRQITHQNDALFSELDLGITEEINFQSKDGTRVGALLTYPVGYVKGTKVPLLLRIHGGPNGQDQHSFSAERQMFAAQGYAVLAVNYRGSSGRGQKFSRAIFADWGNYEVQDLLAGVDHVIKMGVADPDRLGVGGWSYGGILTDYLIATDNRFKAATSGAGTAFTVAFYGTDQYIIQYDYEIGPPWNPKAWETYVKISYPFLHADRIQTPTLFLGGERDFNVPVQGSQQMYQALRSLGIDTQLIIYPNENHGIHRPSYQRDRMERYVAWYDKYVKKSAGPASTSTAQ